MTLLVKLYHRKIEVELLNSFISSSFSLFFFPLCYVIVWVSLNDVAWSTGIALSPPTAYRQPRHPDVSEYLGGRWTVGNIWNGLWSRRAHDQRWEFPRPVINDCVPFCSLNNDDVLLSTYQPSFLHLIHPAASTHIYSSKCTNQTIRMTLITTMLMGWFETNRLWKSLLLQSSSFKTGQREDVASHIFRLKRASLNIYC